MTSNQFRAAIDRLGLSQVGAARLFGADPRTGRRWANGERGIPATIAILLRLLIRGCVSVVDIESVREE